MGYFPNRPSRTVLAMHAGAGCLARIIPNARPSQRLSICGGRVLGQAEFNKMVEGGDQAEHLVAAGWELPAELSTNS